jgi:hypothetical protein
MLNTTQQIGGSLGTALLNTLYASAVAGYLTSHRPGVGGAKVFQFEAFLHGYRVAFVVGGALLTAALVVIVVLVNAKRDELPTPDEAVPAAV